MSRTFRRTRTSKGSICQMAQVEDTIANRLEFEGWVVEANDRRDDPQSWAWLGRLYHSYTLYCATYEQYRIKKIAKFRKDNRPGEYSPPKWWVTQECNRPLRRTHKEQIRTALVNEDTWDGLSLQPYKKNAGWWFW